MKWPTPSILRIPCIEVLFSGLMLVALSFYASMDFGRDYTSNNVNSIAVHVSMCMPYFVLLLWLSIHAGKGRKSRKLAYLSACSSKVS